MVQQYVYLVQRVEIARSCRLYSRFCYFLLETSLDHFTPVYHMYGSRLTMAYTPTQVLNGHPYNRKCDVYSFGICLWEIYCCDMPYPDLSFSEVTSAVVRQV
jgi:serine/threonine protein kinase